MADQQKKPLKKKTFFSPSPKSHISLDFAAKRVIQHPQKNYALGWTLQQI
jgi:hypothetical protein